jgi:hypothetical protein
MWRHAAQRNRPTMPDDFALGDAAAIQKTLFLLCNQKQFIFDQAT